MALALLFIGSGAMAQAVDPSYRYTVQRGDTLLSLARLYMNAQADYVTVQKLNKVADPRQIPVGSTLIVPASVLKSELIVGKISSFKGEVKIDGQPAVLGATVRQGQRVETGAGAFVTVELPDRSAISLPSQSRIYVERLRRILLTGSLDRSFRLEAGRSRSTVTPIKDPDSNFRVTTPLSVSAVRGTDFRVAFDPDKSRAQTEVVGGSVGVAPDKDKDKPVIIPRAYGIVGTPAGLEEPTALLPPPLLIKVEKVGDGAVITAKAVDGAKSYRTQLATDIGFSNVFDEAVNDKPSATFSLPADAAFFVRLTAIAESGLEGMPGTYSLGHPKPLENNSASSAGSGPQSANMIEWTSVDGSVPGHDRPAAAPLIQTSQSGNGRTTPSSVASAKTLR